MYQRSIVGRHVLLGAVLIVAAGFVVPAFRPNRRPIGHWRQALLRCGVDHMMRGVRRWVMWSVLIPPSWPYSISS